VPGTTRATALQATTRALAWSLTTAWAAAAEFTRGRPQQGWSMMKILAEDTERDALACIGECWNPDDLSLT